MKKVLIFGSTGSIGSSALSVIRKDKKEFKVLGLCTNKDIKMLRSQIKEFKPSFVCVSDEGQAKKLEQSLTTKIKLFKGKKGLEKFSSLKSDISLMAIDGISCLEPLLINIKHTKRIALANKESLVVGGSFVFKQAKEFNTQILPVDSEMNALFQLIERQKLRAVDNGFRRVYLTASGGALVGYRKKDLAKVKVKDVLAHPTWKMGRRITVDCATLVNKGFEVIEAHYFFGVPLEKIDIVIHKESTIHALAEYRDSSLLACLYPPDMKIPISFALHYPERFDSGRGINFKSNFSYSFAPISYDKYPLLKIILEAGKRKDNSLVILNAADEVAIDYFLRKRIKFIDIFKTLKYIFRHYPQRKIKTVDDIFLWDNWARIKTKQYLEKL